MPKLILFAGPNGCGKSTLYQTNRELFDNSEQFVKIMTIKKTRIVYKANPLPEWAMTLS